MTLYALMTETELQSPKHHPIMLMTLLLYLYSNVLATAGTAAAFVKLK